MRSVLLRVLLVLHLILGVMYLYWRITQGLEGVKVVGWSALFFVGELFTFLAIIGFSLSQFHQPLTQQMGTYDQITEAGKDLPPIDVLIIRRWDSIEATCQTATAALQMNYPWHRLFVYVIDLESDPDMQQAAQAVPCEYLHCLGLTRDPLEYVLNEVSTFGDLILILEPGQLPDPDLIVQTLPYFLDPANGYQFNDTGFVQANLRALGHRYSDHPLLQVLPIHWDGNQSAPLLGSGSLIRRAALKSLTLTQLDSRRPVLLGTQLHLKGWKSYVCRSSQVNGILLPLRNRRIALLAMLDALKQNPIFSGQTTQVQRFQYLWMGIWCLSGWAHLLYFLGPVLFLTAGLTPVPAFDQAFLSWFLPYLGVGRLAWLVVYWGSINLAWRAERHTGSQFFQSIQALVQSWQKVAPYPEKTSQLSLGPQALITLITLAAIVIGSIRLSQGWDVTWYAFGFGLLWATYNLMILTVKPPGYDVFAPS